MILSPVYTGSKTLVSDSLEQNMEEKNPESRNAFIVQELFV